MKIQVVNIATNRNPLRNRLPRLFTIRGFYDFCCFILISFSNHHLYRSDHDIGRILLVHDNGFYTVGSEETLHYFCLVQLCRFINGGPVVPFDLASRFIRFRRTFRLSVFLPGFQFLLPRHSRGVFPGYVPGHH